MTSPFILQNLIPADRTSLRHGTYIVLFHAKRIPPHLLIIHNGMTWDLSVKGSRKGDPLETLLIYIERRKVVTFFIEWKIKADGLVSILNHHFSNYEKIEAGKNSCLFPIRDVATELHGKELNECKFIFELLPALHRINALGKCLSTNFDDPSFETLTYDQHQLEKSIREAASRNITSAL